MLAERSTPNRAQTLCIAVTALAVSLGVGPLSGQATGDSTRSERGRPGTADSRSVYTASHGSPLATVFHLLQARGVRNPLLVVDGVVMRLPAPLDVRDDAIACVVVRPGRMATLEHRRGRIDDGTDGLVLIWTHGSGTPQSPECPAATP